MTEGDAATPSDDHKEDDGNADAVQKPSQQASNEDDDSDDDLFSAPPPEEDESMSTSAFFEDDDATRTSTNAGNATPVTGDEPESKEDGAGGGSSQRKNKRKNFKPRNILSSGGDENANEEGDQAVAEGENGASNTAPSATGESAPLNLSNCSDAGSPSILGMKKSLLPRRMDDKEGGAAMDLTTPREDGEQEDDDGEALTARSLSVVKPEILFGKRQEEAERTPSSPKSQAASVADGGPSLPFPSLLAPGLAAAMAAMASGGAAASGTPPPAIGSDAMKDAFQEVLKLYGVPTEIAAAIAKNAQTAQGKEC